MQAYGQIISYPYKANTTYDTERLDDFLDVAMVGTDGLRKKGSKTRYKIDSTNDLVENRSGMYFNNLWLTVYMVFFRHIGHH